MGTPERFLNLYRFLRSIVLMGGHFNFDGDKLKTNIQMSFQKVFLNSQLQEQLGKSVVKSKLLPSQGGTDLYRFFFGQISWLDKTRLFFESHFLAIFTKLICHQNFEIGTQDLRGELHVLILLIHLATFHKSPIL